jgi:hypothetical protein
MTAIGAFVIVSEMPNRSADITEDSAPLHQRRMCHVQPLKA